MITASIIHTFWALDLEPSFSLRTSKWELKEQEPSKCARPQVMKFAWSLGYEVWELWFFPEGSLEAPIAFRSVHSTICRSNPVSPSGWINCPRSPQILADFGWLSCSWNWVFYKSGIEACGSPVFSHAEDTSETSTTLASGTVGEAGRSRVPFLNTSTQLSIAHCY